MDLLPAECDLDGFLQRIDHDKKRKEVVETGTSHLTKSGVQLGRFSAGRSFVYNMSLTLFLI
jgi:hypothetical protein